MDFVKVEGLGNDFIVVDGPFDPDPEAISRWCDRHFGIGADGVLELTPVASDTIRMRYWNADGSEAEMCGNGLRCLVRVAVERGLVETRDVVVETAAGPLAASLRADGLVRARVGTPVRGADPFDFEGMRVHPVSIGNPHAVVFVPDTGTAPVREAGPLIEAHEAFPDRANVEFVAAAGRQLIDVRVWERGVGETKASGTGAAAASFAAVTYRDVVSPVEVALPGGTLTIEINEDGAWMTGPANIVYVGSVDQST
jgi:diaminopimelate epimerase